MKSTTGAAAGEDVRRLGALEAGVHRDEHAARRRHAERGDDPLERVRRPDRDPVAGLDARRERARGAASATIAAQRGEVDPPAAVDHGFGVRGAPGGSRTIAGIVGHVTSLRTLTGGRLPRG